MGKTPQIQHTPQVLPLQQNPAFLQYSAPTAISQQPPVMAQTPSHLRTLPQLPQNQPIQINLGRPQFPLPPMVQESPPPKPQNNIPNIPNITSNTYQTVAFSATGVNGNALSASWLANDNSRLMNLLEESEKELTSLNSENYRPKMDAISKKPSTMDAPTDYLENNYASKLLDHNSIDPQVIMALKEKTLSKAVPFSDQLHANNTHARNSFDQIQ